MAEIAEMRGSSGLRAVSTFSGCGGSCLGLEMAGFDVLWASEFVEAARDVYALNHAGVLLDGRDIREVSASDVLEATHLGVGELDLLEGSPPCSSFSTAGKRHRGWGQTSTYSDTKQRTDDLFFEYARLLEGLQPRAFVAENVSGLVKGTAKGYFLEILARLRSCGYVVEARLLDAQWLGVPQARQRLIFQGVRTDLGRRPSWPRPLPYRYSIRDALAGVPVVAVGGAGAFGTETWVSPDLPAHTIGATPSTGNGRSPSSELLVEPEPENGWNAVSRHARVADPDGPAPTIMTHDRGMSQVLVDVDVDPETGYRITLDGHAIAGEWDRLAEGESSERYFNLVRPAPDGPSPTVTQSAGGRGTAGVTHPVQRRKFTIAELRRICGFPDSFVLTGTYPQRWERLGRAVPPPMMRAVAERIRDDVLR